MDTATSRSATRSIRAASTVPDIKSRRWESSGERRLGTRRRRRTRWPARWFARWKARAAVREQIARGADWIKLFPAGAYSFTPAGQVQYQVTYPLPVLQALIDETHSLGKK